MLNIGNKCVVLNNQTLNVKYSLLTMTIPLFKTQKSIFDNVMTLHRICEENQSGTGGLPWQMDNECGALMFNLLLGYESCWTNNWLPGIWDAMPLMRRNYNVNPYAKNITASACAGSRWNKNASFRWNKNWWTSLFYCISLNIPQSDIDKPIIAESLIADYETVTFHR